MKSVKFRQQGAISIFLAVLLLSELLIIGLGISFLSIQQLKMSGQVGQSVVSYYAAEAGAEKCYYQVRNLTGQGCDDTGQISENVGSGDYQASYQAEFSGTHEAGTVVSIGQFGETSRKVDLTWSGL